MKRSARHYHLKAVLIVGVLVPPATGLVHQAHAQDSQSAIGFFVSEAARQARLQPSAPIVPLLHDERYVPERQRAVKALKKMPAAKTRFVRLLEPNKGTAKVPPQSKPLREPMLDAAGAVKAVLSDPTLRPGDIVMFPDGPKVFAGTTGSSHKLSSFQDIGASRLVSKSTRSMVTALAPRTPTTRVTQDVRLQRPTKVGEFPQAPHSGPRVVYQDALVARR